MAKFDVTRSATIAAPPEQVHKLIADFRAWRAWSPWEDVDPDLQRAYSGPEAGTGARYAWQGNRKAGKGNMEITDSAPGHIAIRLEFEKPWKAVNQTRFELAPAGEGTEVTWRMTGQSSGVAGLFARVFSMDKLVGKDFEKGLERMKAAAEAQ